jgi:hypothetical protein
VRKSLVRRIKHEKIAAGHQTKRLGFASLSRKVNPIDDLIRLRESFQSSALRSIADDNQTRVLNLGERLDQMMSLALVESDLWVLAETKPPSADRDGSS